MIGQVVFAVVASIPPPLTPPHKGEGDLPAAMLHETGKDLRSEDAQLNPPPPCGEGLGVGVKSSSVAGGRP